MPSDGCALSNWDSGNSTTASMMGKAELPEIGIPAMGD